MASGLVTLACSGSNSPLHSVLSPCTQPAPLNGAPDPAAEGFIVAYRDGIDIQAETERLADECGFQPTHISQVEPGWFSARLDLVQLACVRCAPSVSSVSFNQSINSD